MPEPCDRHGVQVTEPVLSVFSQDVTAARTVPRMCRVGLLMTFRRSIASGAVLVAAIVLATASGEASESPTCFGRPATRIGTPGPDVLSGTDGPDVIVGLGGNDTIETYGGNDIVCAGPGADTVDLGPGRDIAHAGSGDDVVRGGSGNDKILGAGGDDDLYGNVGRDELRGGAGNDRLHGNRGIDTASGGGGTDECASSEMYRLCETITRVVKIESLVTDGLPDLGRSWDVEEVDFNQDGAIDLLLTTHHNPNTGDPEAGHARDGVYLSNGQGSFRYQELPYLPVMDRHSCNSGDFNADGLTDLFCGVGAGAGKNPAKEDELLIQLPDGTFEDQYASWGLHDPQRRSRYQVVADFNGDGYDDIFGTAVAPAIEGFVSESRLWLSESGHGFVPAPEWGLDGIEHTGFWEECVAGNAEFIAVCGSFGEPFRIFGNTGAGFVPLSSPETWDQVASVTMGDIDNDRDLEFLIVVGGTRELAIYHPHTQTYSMIPVGANLMMAASGDFDGDGFADIYLLNRGSACSSDLAQGPTPDKPGGMNRADTIAFGPTFVDRETVNVPSQGCGDVVVVFDTDGDGNEEAIVTNGHHRAWGPYFIVDLAGGRATVPHIG